MVKKSNLYELTVLHDQLKLLLPKNLFCRKSARKRIVPPIECELSFSTGTFLNNYDVLDRNLKPLVIGSTVGKRAKCEENTIVETTTDGLIT